ncbi:hypothetical protein B0H67DRAFT_684576, partial [Lasiosphaeris hirsuta]
MSRTYAMAFSHDSALLAVASDGYVAVLACSTGDWVYSLSVGSSKVVHGLAFSAESSFLAASYKSRAEQDPDVSYWIRATDSDEEATRTGTEHDSVSEADIEWDKDAVQTAGELEPEVAIWMLAKEPIQIPADSFESLQEYSFPADMFRTRRGRVSDYSLELDT